MPGMIGPTRVDWRWARVAELANLSTTAACARMAREGDDERIRRLYEFRRALDIGMEDEYPEIQGAHEIYMNWPELRLTMEGMLLGGGEDDQIAQRSMCHPSVVAAYHDMFFWVRPALLGRQSAWLNAVLFGGMSSMHAHTGDVHGIALRLALRLGFDGFVNLLDAGLTTQTTRDQLYDLLSQTLLVQASTMAMTVGGAHDLPDWATRVLDNRSDTGGTDDTSDAVESFLRGLAISVADPVEADNLSLPAREDRVIAYSEVTE